LGRRARREVQILGRAEWQRWVREKRREEKNREEKRREEKRQRLAGDTGTSIIHVVCLLHLLPPFVVFHDLRSL